MTLNPPRKARVRPAIATRPAPSRLSVGFTYLSKIENHKLEEGHNPSEKLIHMLAVELDGDEEELLLLAEKVPEPIRRRVIARPEAFRRLAELSDRKLDRILASLD